ncbi:MAG: SpoIIE family protein phosphatase [Sulfobacillus thermotolerans]|nr:SpoIIE family protein phosphatase [Sulfobacillus thermotolerans]
MAGTLSMNMQGVGAREPSPKAQSHKKDIRKIQLMMALVGLVLGQAMIFHRAAPFLWIVLVLVWPRWRSVFGAVLIGGLIGTVLGINWISSVALLGLALAIPMPWHRTGRGWMQWPLVGLGAGGLYLAGRGVNSFEAIMAGLIGMGAILLYWAALRQIHVWDTGQGNQATLVMGLAATGSLIAGLEGWMFGPFSPSLIVGGLLILGAAVLNGPAGGAVAGATLGFTLAVRGSGPGGGLGILVVGGFLAGILASRQWRLAPVGLIAGIVLYAVMVRLPHQMTMLWVSLGVAGVLFQALPGSFVTAARLWVQVLVTGERPDQLPARMEQIAGVMKEMAHAFQIEEEETGQETSLVEVVVGQVCRKCSLYRSCWEDEFYRSYRGLLDLTNQPTGELLSVADLSGDLQKRCIRPDAVVQAANVALGKERERARYRLRVKESRALAERQLGGLASLIQEMAQDLSPGHMPRAGVRVVEPALDCEVGVAKRPRRGGIVTGDSEMVCELGKDRVVFALSDGMGVGPRAAWESGTAVALLEQLLKAGFNQVLAVRAVNTTLLLRSVEDHFATLDLLMVDRVGKGAEMVKVAAAPTFLCRNRRVEIIRSHAVPVGILQEVHVEPVYHTLDPGDLIVMVTDGVLEGADAHAEETLSKLLQEMPTANPQVMAETILSYMLGHDQDGRDDAAVMVVQIKGHRQASRIPSISEPREWQHIPPVPLKASRR